MSSYKHYILKQGDTLQSIAQTLYSDIDEWRMLVNLNHLHYPYIVTTAQQKMNDPEHLLTYGDELLLPNDAQTFNEANQNKIIESNTPHYQPAYYDTVLGTDIKLNISTDVPLSEQLGVIEANNSDLETVTGIQNLKQSLINRILTRRGTLLFHPNYGSQLPNMLGKPMNHALLEDACTELSRTITTDTRVAKCKVSKSLLSYNDIFMNAIVTPIKYAQAFNIYLYRSKNGQFSIR